MLHIEEIQEIRATIFGELAKIPIHDFALVFGELAKIPIHDFALVQEHGRVRLVDVVLGQLSWLPNSFGTNRGNLLSFGRGPSQNPQNFTLAALKFGGGNVKHRRFGVKRVVSDKTNPAGTLGVPCLAQIPKGFGGHLKGRPG